MIKQCGTLYMSETQTKLCTKKNGSASNKKNSFKIDWPLNQKRNKFYLACDSLSETNEWMSLLNHVSTLNKNETTQAINNNNIIPKSIIKQQQQQQQKTSTIGPLELTTPLAYKLDKANSAPNSPTYTRNQKRYQTIDNKSLNEQNNKQLEATTTTHNRSTSLTRIRQQNNQAFNLNNCVSQPNLNDNNNNNNKENYQLIYEAFEKPVEETRIYQNQHKVLNNNALLQAANNVNNNLVMYKRYKSDQNIPSNLNYSNIQQHQQQQQQPHYLGKSQIITPSSDNYDQYIQQ
jgi:hypothetical protein